MKVLACSSRPSETHRFRPATGAAMALAIALGGTGMPAEAAPDAETAALIEALSKRLKSLETRNAALEREVQTLRQGRAVVAAPAAPAAPATTADPALTDRVRTLEAENMALKDRVDAVARTTQPTAAEEPGIEVEGGLIGVVQNVNGAGSETGDRQTRADYRGDVEVSLPLGTVAALGDARLDGFGHLRFGQGGGVSMRPTYTGAYNSVGFEAGAGSSETYAIVAQAYANLTWPLESGRFNDLPGNRIELTVGKLDLFGFFDQNAAADDEGAAFMNNVFVHNPLLDSGGDITADDYGFAPAIRVAYVDEGDRWGWGASLGVFGAGDASGFNSGFSRPLVIAQVEASPKLLNGDPKGTYRLYAWTNGQTTNLAGDRERHSGYGLSVDQQMGGEWTLFGRWGQRTSGEGAFDKALTLGFEHGGRHWGRGNDAVGLAVGWIKTSGEYEAATRDPLFAGYRASGAETVGELYYRMKLNDHVEISPDYQLVHRAGGDGDAGNVHVFGVRATVGF